jgi:hypothetical protein
VIARAAKKPTAKAVKARATNKLNPTHHTVMHLVSRMVRRDPDGPTLKHQVSEGLRLVPRSVPPWKYRDPTE